MSVREYFHPCRISLSNNDGTNNWVLSEDERTPPEERRVSPFPRNHGAHHTCKTGKGEVVLQEFLLLQKYLLRRGCRYYV